MSLINTTVEVKGLAEADARLKAAGKKLADELAPIIETVVRETVENHLDAHYVGKPNKLGGAPTNYWGKVKNNVVSTHEGNAVNVTLSGVGLWMKYMGGTIRPSGNISVVTGKPIRWLTVPVHASAHGKRASDFGKNLYVRGFAGGAGRSEGDSAQGMGLWLKTGGESSDSDPLLFWLRKSVTIKPDKNILPPGQVVADEVVSAVKTLLEATA